MLMPTFSNSPWMRGAPQPGFDELGRAAMTIQTLVAEKGRRNITVTSGVEPTGPALLWLSPTVRITFVATERVLPQSAVAR